MENYQADMYSKITIIPKWAFLLLLWDPLSLYSASDLFIYEHIQKPLLVISSPDSTLPYATVNCECSIEKLFGSLFTLKLPFACYECNVRVDVPISTKNPWDRIVKFLVAQESNKQFCVSLTMTCSTQFLRLFERYANWHYGAFYK